MAREHKPPTANDSPAVIAHRPQTELSSSNPDGPALLLAAQQIERKRIAQELHDTLLQGFTCVALKLDALTNSLPPEMAKAKEQLQRILEKTDEYLAEARRSIWKLRSPTLDGTEDLPRALVKASERALVGTGIQLKFFVQGTKCTIGNFAEDNLLRICEEAIANAVRHGQATEVELTLKFNPVDVQLGVRDNGCGFTLALSDTAKRGHFGLLGIAERVEALSGTFSIDTSPGRGVNLLVTIPMGRQEL